jgi:hypothetical protein
MDTKMQSLADSPALAGVFLPPHVVNTLNGLAALNRNSFCAIDGYTSQQGEVSNYLVRAATSAESVYSATAEELEAVKFSDLDLSKWVPNKGKNSFATAEEQFNFNLGVKLESIRKTQSGERDDPHRQGHDRCSRSPAPGITVDLVTEKAADGLKYPVVDSAGNFIAKGVRLSCVVHKKEVLVEGERKTVNSGSKVLMDNAIEAVLKKNRTALRTFSLDEGKFVAIRSGSLSL